MFESLTAAFDRLSSVPRGKDLSDAYYAEFGSAYAALLDEIMPGWGWFKPERDRSDNLTSEYCKWGVRRMPDTFSLFDHPVLMRKRGLKGPTTWGNSAMIGQPYGSPNPQLAGIRWLQERGVAAWTRPDLSLWCPGSTQLVIAAKELAKLNEEKFGFEKLG
jgi:hypothetical protein